MLPYHFGVYHWRRRGRRLVRAVGLLGLSLAAWLLGRRLGRRPAGARRRWASRSLRVLAAGLAVAGVRRGRPTLERLFSPPPWALERYKYDALAEHLPLAAADRLLDVGCGTGRSLVGLAPALASCRVLGLDVFDDRVILGNGAALARRNATRAGLDCEVVAGDAARLPVAGGSQDVVTACRVLHDLPPEAAERALAEARRVLAPDGRLGVLELRSHDGSDPVDYWRERIADAGFAVERAERVRRGGEPTGYLIVVARPAD